MRIVCLSHANCIRTYLATQNARFTDKTANKSEYILITRIIPPTAIVFLAKSRWRDHSDHREIIVRTYVQVQDMHFMYVVYTFIARR